MTKNIFRMGVIVALSVAASQTILSAQDIRSVEGVWDVSVTVVDCQTGAPIRTVRSVQGFLPGGSFTETANTASRGSSIGTWNRAGGPNYNARYWFFRYQPDGTFASIAKAVDSVTLDPDGDTFTASGTVQDFDANNNLISTGCFTHAATRLSAPERGR